MRDSELGVRIAECARMLVGTPFHWHGRVPGVGLDCSGVLVASFAGVGIELSSPKRYGRRSHLELFDEHLSASCRRIELGEPLEPGDVLVFEASSDEAHAGIWTDSAMVHADGSPTTSRVVETPIPEVLKPKLARVYRVIE